MHIALIADEERLRDEHSMLNRLSVALIDEGTQLTRLVPENMVGEGVEQDERKVALAHRVPVPMRVLPWLHRARARHLAEALGRSMPDVLYAVGDAGWRVAMELAPEIERPVVLDVWRLAQARRVARQRPSDWVAGYVAPTEPLAQELRRRVGEDMVSIVPYGVSVPAQPGVILSEAANMISLAVVGGCHDLPAYRAVLGALAQLVKQFPQVQAFIELRGRFQHEVWRMARRLELLPYVSGITNASQHRPLLIRCDVMILPERLGELRSMTLEAMAAGMPVIAGDDPMRQMLRDGQTGFVVAEATVESWVGRLRLMLSQPERAREVGLAGRAWVTVRHRSSDQARKLLDVLETIVHKGTYVVSQAGG